MAEKHPKQPTDEAAKAKALSRWEGEGGAPVEALKPKRPRDLNQWAKRMVDLATGDAAENAPVSEARAASGAKGGSARASRLSPEERAEAARLAAQARWRRKTD